MGSRLWHAKGEVGHEGPRRHAQEIHGARAGIDGINIACEPFACENFVGSGLTMRPTKIKSLRSTVTLLSSAPVVVFKVNSILVPAGPTAGV